MQPVIELKDPASSLKLIFGFSKRDAMRKVSSLYLQCTFVQIRHGAGDRSREFGAKQDCNNFNDEKCDGGDDHYHESN